MFKFSDIKKVKPIFKYTITYYLQANKKTNLLISASFISDGGIPAITALGVVPTSRRDSVD